MSQVNYFRCKVCQKLLRITTRWESETEMQKHLLTHDEHKEQEGQLEEFEEKVRDLEQKYNKRMLGAWFNSVVPSEAVKKEFPKRFLSQEDVLEYLKKGFQLRYYLFGWSDQHYRAELRGVNDEYIPNLKLNVLVIQALIRKKLVKHGDKERLVLA